jgi:hypothetical protein
MNFVGRDGVSFGVREKILVSFVALSLISMGIISSVSLRFLSSSNMRMLDKMSEITAVYESNDQNSQIKIASIVKNAEEESNRERNECQLIMIVVIIAMVIVACSVSFLLAETFTRPLNKILKISQCAIDNVPCDEKIETGD